MAPAGTDPRMACEQVPGERVVQEDSKAAPPGRAGGEHRSLTERFDDWAAGYPDVVGRRLLHKAPIVLWRLGLGGIVGRPWMLLTTKGRASGLPRRTTLTAHRVRGRLYAWSPYGERSHWYRNLIADPIVTVQTSGRAWTRRAERLDDAAEVAELYESLRRFDARLLRRYLDDQGINDTAADVVANKDRLHLIRFAPTSRQGPAPLQADLCWVWALPAVIAVVWKIAFRRRS